MFFRLICIALAMLVIAPVLAKDIIRGDIETANQMGGTLAAIEDLQVLVRKTKMINVCDGSDCLERESDLRVSSVLVSSGPSTDVSPGYAIYLVMNNEVEEHAVAFSYHRIAFADELKSVERLKAGIYRFVYVAHDYSDACFIGTLETTVDARELSAAVRLAKKTSFFEDAFYDDPIYLTHKKLGCAY